jgi:hypothetical protein
MKKVIVVMVVMAVMLLAWSFSARPKRRIILLLLTAVMLLAGGVLVAAHAQSPRTDLKPTFISPTSGLYVNGWPAFTVTYPKEWTEFLVAVPGSVFMAGVARPDLPPSLLLTISVIVTPVQLEDWAKIVMPAWVYLFRDIKVLSDKPSLLTDDTPAREVEVESVPKTDPSGHNVNDAPKSNAVYLATKKDLIWVSITVRDYRGKLGEDLKKIVHSLSFQPDREKPVQVSTDVKAFLDMWCADVVSRDIKLIMAHFSDRFLYSGASKAPYEQFFRNNPLSPLQRGVTSCEATVTLFEPHGDKAYIDGFMSEKAKGDTSAGKFPMSFQQIINEHGQWKWYGNQR